MDIKELFNGYIGANVLFVLNDVGFFNYINNKETFDIHNTAKDLDIDVELFAKLCYTLEILDILKSHGNDVYSLTDEGKRAKEYIGFFTWLVGGYGNVLQNASKLLSKELVYSQDISRDDYYMAKGSGECGVFIDPFIYEIMDQIEFNKVVDIGCGSGKRLIEFCKRYKGISGVGIDISYKACKLAKQNVLSAKMEDRITLIFSSIESVVDEHHISLLEDVDIVTCFLMLHDLIKSEEYIIEFLGKIKSIFKNAKYYLFADTNKIVAKEDLKNSPIFSLGFELVHCIMERKIYPQSYYNEIFDKSGFNVLKCVKLNVPETFAYLLTPK